MDEVQGIILRGYELLKVARFVLLTIADPITASRAANTPFGPGGSLTWYEQTNWNR